jgi:hypothetical protein
LSETDRRAFNGSYNIRKERIQPSNQYADGFHYIFDGYPVNTVVFRRHRRGGSIMADSIEKAMKNAKASLENSGFKVTEEHTDLVRKVLMKEMTDEEFLKEAKRLAEKKSGGSKS